jgi:hypothetical protein
MNKTWLKYIGSLPYRIAWFRGLHWGWVGIAITSDPDNPLSHHLHFEWTDDKQYAQAWDKETAERLIKTHLKRINPNNKMELELIK